MIRFLKHEWKSLAWVCGLAILMQILDYQGWLAGPEGRVADWLLRAKDRTGGNSLVSLVEIDGTAYDLCFDSVSPMYAKRVMGLVNGVAQADPRVIGIDIMTAARIRAPEYRKIADGLGGMRPKLVWISGIDQAEWEVVGFKAWLLGQEDELLVKPLAVLGFVGPELEERRDIAWAVPVFPPDQDSGLRRFPRHVRLAEDLEQRKVVTWGHTWARRVAEEFCLTGARCFDQSADEVMLSYNVDQPHEFTMPELFDCEGNPRKDNVKWVDFERNARGRIVLIGGTFPESGDFHQTPAGRRTPGLLVNAYAIQAEMDGSDIREFWRPAAVLYDIGIGVALVLLLPLLEWAARNFPEESEWRGRLENNPFQWMIGGGLMLILFAVGLTMLLFGRGYLISFLGVAIGVLLHEIVEVWNVNPQLAQKD